MIFVLILFLSFFSQSTSVFRSTCSLSSPSCQFEIEKLAFIQQNTSKNRCQSVNDDVAYVVAKVNQINEKNVYDWTTLSTRLVPCSNEKPLKIEPQRVAEFKGTCSITSQVLGRQAAVLAKRREEISEFCWQMSWRAAGYKTPTNRIHEVRCLEEFLKLEQK